MDFLNIILPSLYLLRCKKQHNHLSLIKLFKLSLFAIFVELFDIGVKELSQNTIAFQNQISINRF
jgi:hypothetical protein